MFAHKTGAVMMFRGDERDYALLISLKGQKRMPNQNIL
jgi:hypothetical protein